MCEHGCHRDDSKQTTDAEMLVYTHSVVYATLLACGEVLRANSLPSCEGKPFQWLLLTESSR